MAIGKLEFDLSDPEDRDGFEKVVKVNDLYFAIGEFSQELRLLDRGKKEHGFATIEDAISEIREFFYKCLNERCIDTSELI